MQLFRAFISHSSHDKEFADMIFAQLDRASVIYDRCEFDDGDILTEAIAARIAECGIFVLLGSKAALESKWVKLEMQAAQSLREAGLMNDALLFTLGDATHRDYPSWLAGMSITPAQNPAHVATAVQEKQLELIDRVQHPVFLNRHNEIAESESHLQGRKTEVLVARKTVAFFGQGGFGRRTLARLVFRNVCGLTKAFVLRVESGDNFRDFTIKLAQHSTKYYSQEELRVALDEITSSTDDELVHKAEVCLSQLVSTNTLLIMQDYGGLLDADGFLYPSSSTLVSAIENTPGCYAAIITRRKPHARTGLAIPGVSVGDFKTDVAGALVERYADVIGLDIKSDAAVRMASRVGGHPAALKYAVDLALEYGLDAILADKAFLTEHNIERYWQEVKSDRSLGDLHKAIMATLAAYETATLDVLVATLAADRATVAEAVRHLIELVLVTVDPSGQYYLSSALFDVVPRLFPNVVVDHDRGYEAFTEYLDRNPDVENRLGLERSRGVAATLGHSAEARDRVLMLAADYVRVADVAYRDERYKMAFEYADLAITMRPGNYIAIRTYIQAGVKGRFFAEAATCLERNVGNLQAHEVEYFRGVIARGKGLYDDALSHYKRALDLGRRGLAIHRDLSLCFYKLGHIPEAENHLRQAFREIYGAKNPYLLDLGIRIAISKGDEAEARRLLDDTRLYDKPHHALSLEASVELAFGDPKIAARRLAVLGAKAPYFGRYLRIVADLRENDLLSAQRSIQGLAKSADPVDAKLLDVALLWSRGRADEAIAKIGYGDANADQLRYRELSEFMLSKQDPTNPDARRQLTKILINQEVAPISGGDG